MAHVTYKVVQHDGGWTYTMDGVYAETFHTRDQAIAAVRTVAAEQRTPGNTEAISWESADGIWHDETAPGEDRPEVDVEG